MFRCFPPHRHARPSTRRRLRLTAARIRRLRYRINRRLTLFSGWVWIAAISFVGIEMFDIVFGTFLLAPELLPVVLIGLAMTWYFRETLRAWWRSGRIRLRLVRRAQRRKRTGPRALDRR